MPYRRNYFDWDEYRERAMERWEDERDDWDWGCECHDLWFDYSEAHAVQPPADLICDFCERKQRAEAAMREYEKNEAASIHARRLMQNRWYQQCDAIRGYLDRTEKAADREAKCAVARQLCTYLIGQTLFLRENDGFRAAAKTKATEFVRVGTPDLVTAAEGLLEIIAYVEAPAEEPVEEYPGVSTAEQLTVDQ
jgi:hypothetical protein